MADAGGDGDAPPPAPPPEVKPPSPPRDAAPAAPAPRAPRVDAAALARLEAAAVRPPASAAQTATLRLTFDDALREFWAARGAPVPQCSMAWCRLTMEPWALWERVQARRARPARRARAAARRLEASSAAACERLTARAFAARTPVRRQRCGGYDAVTERKLWRTVGSCFSPPGAWRDVRGARGAAAPVRWLPAFSLRAALRRLFPRS